MPITEVVVERFLRGVPPDGRTGVLISAWATTWGSAIVAIAAGWKAGLAWLVVLGTVTVLLRNNARTAVGPEGQAPAERSLEDRVFERLEQLHAEISSGTPFYSSDVPSVEVEPEPAQSVDN